MKLLYYTYVSIICSCLFQCGIYFNCTDLIWKNYFKMSDVYILVKRALEKLHLHQTHIMTHTKQEPRGRPRDPFLCRKTILESIKSVSISN